MTSFTAGQRLTADDLQGFAVACLLTGTEVVSFSSATSNIRTVSFGRTLPAPPAMVSIVISTGSGTATGWGFRTDTYTTTSFRLILATNGSAVAWTNIPVKWHAIGPLS